MNEKFIELSYWQVGIATSLIVISAVISLVLRLGLERRLLWASLRTVVQLVLVGLVLGWIFRIGQWYLVLSLMAAMTVVAGVSAAERISYPYRGMMLDSVIAIWAGAWCVTAIALSAVLRPEPLWQPQQAIPILGMILHNTLNGVSLGLDRFGSELAGKPAEVETLLALGATRWEAARGAIRQAARTGMIPTLNTMMVIGIVSLPGMMTGQLLAGIRPSQAVMYQIIIMFFIAASASLGTVIVVLLGYRRLFNRQHQFLRERLRQS